MNRFILEYRANERITEFVRKAETAHGRRHEPFANIQARVVAALKLSHLKDSERTGGEPR